jgi:hypothetical protein
MEFLQGYKTYIVCAGAIATAVGAYANKSIDLTTLVQSIFAALGGITLRAGIAKGAQ